MKITKIKTVFKTKIRFDFTKCFRAEESRFFLLGLFQCSVIESDKHLIHIAL